MGKEILGPGTWANIYQKLNNMFTELFGFKITVNGEEKLLSENPVFTVDSDVTAEDLEAINSELSISQGNEYTLGYSDFADTSSGAVNVLWVNKNSASTVASKAKALRIKLLSTGVFSLIQMRISGTKYTKVGEFVLTSANNNSVLQEFDLTGLNIDVQIGDVFGIITYTGSARPRYNSSSQGRSYLQVAGSVTNLEFLVSTYNAASSLNQAFCFDVITETLEIKSLKSEVVLLKEQQAVASGVLSKLDTNPRFILPSVVYAVVGFDLTIFYNAIGLSFDFDENLGYRVITDCAIGKGYGTFYRVNPASAGDYTLTFRAYSYAKKQLAEKVVTLRAIAAAALPSLKNILFIGDSLTEPGTTANQVLTNIQTIGGTKPKLWGTTKPNTDSANEGHGGWKYQSFSTAGVNYYRVNVTGLAGTVSTSARYSQGANVFSVVEVNITDGTGYISFSQYSGSGQPTANGSLTLSFGTGPSTIAYTGMAVQPANPLWNLATNSIDLNNYKYTVLGMPASSYFDVVSIQLGINDMMSGSTNKTDAEINTVLDNAKIVIDAFLADNVNTKIALNLSPLCNSTGGGFGTEEAYKSYIMNMHRLAELTLSRFASYNARLFIGYAALSLHRLHGYASAPVEVFPGKTVTINTNNVHPNTDGYRQIGNGAFPLIYSLVK